MSTSHPDQLPPTEGAAAHDHRDVVREAIRGRTQALIAGVLLANACLGAWMIQRADFSQLKPNGTPDATELVVPAEIEVEIPTPRPEDGRAQLVFAASAAQAQ